MYVSESTNILLDQKYWCLYNRKAEYVLYKNNDATRNLTFEKLTNGRKFLLVFLCCFWFVVGIHLGMVEANKRKLPPVFFLLLLWRLLTE